MSCGGRPKVAILDRCVFKNRNEDVYLVADAYQGSEIKSAVTDFLSAAAGITSESIHVKLNSAEVSIAAGGAADVLAYVGHEAFMDFQIPPISGTSEATLAEPSSWPVQARLSSVPTSGKPAPNRYFGQPA